MKVSIITINKNNSEGLKKTISSVKSQDQDILEFIIIDGASTDESLNVIEENISYIDYFISETDFGIYDAMNKGIDASTGEYVLFLNSGDCFYNSSVLYDFAQKKYVEDFVLGGVCFFYNSNTCKSLLPKKMFFFDFLEGICHQSTFIKRNVFNNVGKYKLEYKIAADWVLLMEGILLNKLTYTIHKEYVAFYNLDGVSSKASSKSSIDAEKKLFLLNSGIKYNNCLYKLYRYTFRILKIRLFYKRVQCKLLT